MRILYILLIVSGLASSVFGQKAPGYMGKKTKIVYSGIISPVLGYPNSAGNSDLFSFNFSHNLSIERAANRIRSYAVALEMFSSKLDMTQNRFTELAYHPEFDFGNGGEDLVEFQAQDLIDLRVLAVSLNSIRYGTGMAPFGVNFYWGVKVLMMEEDLTSSTFKSVSLDTYNSGNWGIEGSIYYVPKDDTYKTTTIGINFGGEINRAIQDVVVINLGVQSTILPTYVGTWFGGGSGGTPSFESELEFQHKNRMVVHQIFSMKIGVGILLP
ncbi:MAG: hypothetical protein KDD41_08375 [Flavobacteriales bacterium]|nr:hypothetical protein [Flavobacteriales bacterium]